MSHLPLTFHLEVLPRDPDAGNRFWTPSGIDTAIRDLTARTPRLVTVINETEALISCRGNKTCADLIDALNEQSSWSGQDACITARAVDQATVDAMLESTQLANSGRRSSIQVLRTCHEDSDDDSDPEIIQSDEEGEGVDENDFNIQRRQQLKEDAERLQRCKEEMIRNLEEQKQVEIDRLKQEMEARTRAAEQKLQEDAKRQKAEVEEERERQTRQWMHDVEMRHREQLAAQQQENQRRLEQLQGAVPPPRPEASEKLCDTLDALRAGFMEQTDQLRRMSQRSVESTISHESGRRDDPPEQRLIHSKCPTIPVLNGKETPQEYREWRRTVKWLQTTYSDRMMQNGIITALKEEAARKVGAPREGTSSEDIIKTLDNSYLVKRTSGQYRSLMDSMKQGKHEAMGAFVTGIEAVWDEAHQEFPDRFQLQHRQKDIFECIKSGSLPEMKSQFRWLLANESTTIPQFIHECKTVEAENDVARIAAKAKAVTVHHKAAVAATPTPAPAPAAPAPATEAAKDPIQAELKKLNKQIKKLQQRPKRLPQWRINEETQEKEYRCYNCDKYGHMARECTEPQRERRTGGRQQPTQAPAQGNDTETGGQVAAAASQ